MFILSLRFAAKTSIDPQLAAKPRMPKHSNRRTSCTSSPRPPNRRMPASTNAYTPTNSSTVAPSAAVMTSSLDQPHVRVPFGRRRISTAVSADAASTDMSVSMWPASTSNANDPVTIAPTTSAMNTDPVSTSVATRRR